MGKEEAVGEWGGWEGRVLQRDTGVGRVMLPDALSPCRGAAAPPPRPAPPWACSCARPLRSPGVLVALPALHSFMAATPCASQEGFVDTGPVGAALRWAEVGQLMVWVGRREVLEARRGSAGSGCAPGSSRCQRLQGEAPSPAAGRSKGIYPCILPHTLSTHPAGRSKGLCPCIVPKPCPCAQQRR